jgi:hypothetical protein
MFCFVYILDNAWLESEAMNMHDETGELTKDLKLEAGNYWLFSIDF